MAVPASSNTDLIARVTEYVREYMSHYDGSHDYSHIQRVVNLAHHIYESEAPRSSKPLDRDIVTLAALLHDVGDSKYLKEGEDSRTMVRELLVQLGAQRELAEKVQAVCLGVSYSSEIKDLKHVVQLIERYPELAIVQDSDRLDAIGGVGIGRTFAFGGARNRGMQDTVQHFEDKLLRLESMMKTDTGKKLAASRTERMRTFISWWDEEVSGSF